MEIVGRGFLATHLRPICDGHPGVVVFAAGVSAAGQTSPLEFTREAALLRDVVRHCAERRRRLVFFSTASTGMYSARSGHGREDRPVHPVNPYAAHKLAEETLLAESAVDYLTLRLSHVVGPNQPAHQLIPALVAQIRSGTVQVHADAQRDLIDVADVVLVVQELLNLGLSRDVVNVASGFPVPVDRIVAHLETCLGRHATWQLRTSAVLPPVPVPASTEKLRRLVPAVAELGFGPTYFRRVLDRYAAAYSTPA